MSNVVIVGASRGLGLALANGLIAADDQAWLVSHNEPPPVAAKRVTWVPTDLTDADPRHEQIGEAIGSAPIHTFIYNAGAWESDQFDRVDVDELMNIINVSLCGAVQIVHRLRTNLTAGAGNVIFIGSAAGLDNEGAADVAYAAAKFGLRGAAHALRAHFRTSMVRVTCLNPGSIATDLPLGAADQVRTKYGLKKMPVEDIVALVRCILSLSPAACVKEVSMPATLDGDV